MPQPPQQQNPPGTTAEMRPKPDHGEDSYEGTGKLTEEAVESFGEQAPLQRPGQPAELAPIYVRLASDEVSYVSGAIVPATGGRPML